MGWLMELKSLFCTASTLYDKDNREGITPVPGPPQGTTLLCVDFRIVENLQHHHIQQQVNFHSFIDG